MLFEDFQDGYLNGPILAILNFHVFPTQPTKSQLNPIYNAGGDVKNAKS